MAKSAYFIKLTTKFVIKFCPKFNYVEPKKYLLWSQNFFKDKKIINF